VFKGGHCFLRHRVDRWKCMWQQLTGATLMHYTFSDRMKSDYSYTTVAVAW